MAADVAPCTRDRLQVVRRLGADGQPAQPLQPGRDELGGVRGEHGEQPGQVGAVPVPRHVGLAEPDQAGGAEPAEELPGPVQAHDRGGRSPGTVQASVGQADPHRQPDDRRAEQDVAPNSNVRDGHPSPATK